MRTCRMNRPRACAQAKGSCFFGTTAFQPQTWCSGGVPAKIERNEKALSELKTEEPVLMNQEKELKDETIPANTKKLVQMQKANQRKDKLEAERLDMYEGSIAGSPSPLLTALHTAVANWQAAVNLELQIQQGMSEVSKTCRKALGFFHEAQVTELRPHKRSQCQSLGLSARASATHQPFLDRAPSPRGSLGGSDEPHRCQIRR